MESNDSLEVLDIALSFPYQRFTLDTLESPRFWRSSASIFIVWWRRRRTLGTACYPHLWLLLSRRQQQFVLAVVRGHCVTRDRVIPHSRSCVLERRPLWNLEDVVG